MNPKCVISLLNVLVLGTFVYGSPIRSTYPIKQDSTDLQQKMKVIRQDRTSVSKELRYQILLKALWGGHYTFLIDYGSDDGNMDAREHQLKARAAGIQFLRYVSGDLRKGTTYEQRLKIYNHLAPLCTKHYEAAVCKSPDADRYTRAQLANEWLAFKAYDNFKSDSQLLRCQLPTHPEYESRASREEMEAQANRFRNVVEEAFEEGKQGKIFAQQTRDDIARYMVAEFRIYSKIGIPENVFNEIIRDIPYFFDEGLPMQLFKKMSRISEARDTFKWYLWQAIITDLADDAERSEIERQIEYLNNVITNSMKELDIPTEYRSHFDTFITQWKSMYHRFRDNRFAPYFKRVLPEYRFKVVCTQVKEAFARNRREFDEDLAQLAWLPQDNEKEDKMPDICKEVGFATLVDIFSHYTLYDRPIYIPLPDKTFYQDKGTLNKYSVYTFIPGAGTPF